jgi:hypothetical protein
LDIVAAGILLIKRLCLQQFTFQNLIFGVKGGFFLTEAAELLRQLPHLLPTLLQFTPHISQIFVIIVHFLPLLIHIVILFVEVMGV